MLDDPEFRRLLTELIAQWNIAERRIKRAEQVRENEIVSTAIYELRYAGRKIMDAIHLATTEDWRNNGEIRGRIRSYLDDATEDCVKAKHDAIDSMIDFVTTWLYTQERKLGFGTLQRFYPNYLTITATLANIQDLVEESRGNRTNRRDSLYDEIENSGYTDVIQFYFQVRQSLAQVETQLENEARREARIRMRERVVLGVGIVEILVGVALIALHFHAIWGALIGS
jgi:hypothetical protein